MNTDLLSPVALEGEHVGLEPLSLDHLDGLSRIALEPALWQWAPTPITSSDDLRDYVEQAIALADEGAALPFATIERATGTVVGSTRFAAIEREHGRPSRGMARRATRARKAARTRMTGARGQNGPAGHAVRNEAHSSRPDRTGS
jgi:hypothetical protein